MRSAHAKALRQDVLYLLICILAVKLLLPGISPNQARPLPRPALVKSRPTQDSKPRLCRWRKLRLEGGESSPGTGGDETQNWTRAGTHPW